MSALMFDRVGFIYPDGTRALRDVSFGVEPGQRVAIVGQNGSGKSTLVRHLNGLLRPTEGRVLVEDREVGHRHVAELARSVGLAFQNPDRQIFAGQVRREVEFGPRNLGRRGEDLRRVVDGALALVGLDGEAETNPYDLGFSRRKLLALLNIYDVPEGRATVVAACARCRRHPSGIVANGSEPWVRLPVGPEI